MDLCPCTRSQVLNKEFPAMHSEDQQARSGTGGGGKVPSKYAVLRGQAPLC